MKITTTTHMKIGEYKNASESVDVACIGAGGGSIARLDERGMLYEDLKVPVPTLARHATAKAGKCLRSPMRM